MAESSRSRDGTGPAGHSGSAVPRWGGPATTEESRLAAHAGHWDAAGDGGGGGWMPHDATAARGRCVRSPPQSGKVAAGECAQSTLAKRMALNQTHRRSLSDRREAERPEVAVFGSRTYMRHQKLPGGKSIKRCADACMHLLQYIR
jgi:hypothetical protein